MTDRARAEGHRGWGSALLVDPAEIPSSEDVGTIGRALAARSLSERDELMANLAAYSGLRWGEMAALTIGQVALAARVITVDRKVVQVGGCLFVEAPKNRKFRRTIYPRRTPVMALPYGISAGSGHEAGERASGNASLGVGRVSAPRLVRLDRCPAAPFLDQIDDAARRRARRTLAVYAAVLGRPGTA